MTDELDGSCSTHEGTRNVGLFNDLPSKWKRIGRVLKFTIRLRLDGNILLLFDLFIVYLTTL